jgi:hypothetical protein
MKRLLFTLLVLTSFLRAQLPFTYETDSLLTSSGDFGTVDGRSDVIVVERTTGLVTIGKTNSDNTMTWTNPEPCGLTGITGLAVGPFNGGTADVAAITAPGGNRITLAALATANTQLQFRHIYTTNPSCRSLAPFDANTDGIMDLFAVGSISTSPASYHYEVLTNVPTTASTLWQESLPFETNRIHRFIQKTGVAPVVAEHYSTLFYMKKVTSTGVSEARALSGVFISKATLMTYGIFDGGSLSQVILYEPGSLTAIASKVAESSPGNFHFTATTTLTFPKAVRQLVTIPVSAGLSRLGVLYTDSSAAIFNFDGTTLTPRSTLSGTPHQWLNPIGTDLLLTKASTGWQRFNTSFNNALLNPTGAGANYPAFTSASRVSNVVFLNGEPFVDPTATPVAQASIRAWSTAASGSGTAWSITSAPIDSAGIGTPTVSSYTASNSANYAITNQFRPNISLTNLQPAAGAITSDLTITPAGGTFRPADGNLRPAEKVTLIFNPTVAGDDIKYRLNGGSWLFYDFNTPPVIEATTFVEAYAYSTTPRRSSPTRSATYTFAAAPALSLGATVDADSDGLPDAWEKAFNSTTPNGDTDGDGVSNLAEYLAGNDPRDSLSAPPLPPLTVASSLVSVGNNGFFRLEWSAALGNPILESNTTLTGSWTSVVSGIQLNGQTFSYQTPASGSKAFYRLRRP